MHSLALLPAAIFLLMAIWSSVLALDICDMHLLYPDAGDATCSQSMTLGVALLVSAIGAMCWHAAYALRPVCWEVTCLVTKIFLVLPREWIFASSFFSDSVMILTGLASAFLRSVLVEGLRVLGQELCVIVILALVWHSNRTSVKAADVDDTCWVGVDDPRFPLALWLGIGWATAEVVAGSYQLCKFLPLFRSVEDTTPPDEEDILNDFVQPNDDDEDRSGSESSSTDEEEELSLDDIILVREKSELEEQLGEFLENISPATITLWRMDSVLWNLGSCLMLSASLTHAQGCLGDATTVGNSYAFLPFPSIGAIWPTLLLLISLHTLATTIWMMALPRLGLTSITYTTMLVGLALLSAGLGRWGALA